MIKIASQLENVKTVAITGHVRPDGDCIGSCMGLYLYLKEQYPELLVDIYLEQPKSGFEYIEKLDEIRTTFEQGKVYDLFISLDVSSIDRIGVAGDAFANTKKTLCIDHHISNPGFGMSNEIHPDISSASEVLYMMLEEDKITQSVAAALYTGMAHDTGVFQYSSTTSKTMQIAGKLMDTGIDFTKIVDESFYTKSYAQNQILGRCLMESIMVLDGKCIVGMIRQKDMDFYGIKPPELDGIVSQLRVTRGVEAAIFLYETSAQEYKVSLRSNGKMDVNAIATSFGGGGHVRAAGCSMHGSIHDVINNLTYYMEKQLMEES